MSPGTPQVVLTSPCTARPAVAVGDDGSQWYAKEEHQLALVDRYDLIASAAYREQQARRVGIAGIPQALLKARLTSSKKKIDVL